MKCNPIPIRDLIHSATLKTVIDEDFGEVIDSDTFELTNVRIEATQKANNGSKEEQDKTTFVMFFDVVNSKLDSDTIDCEAIDVFKLEQRLKWAGYGPELTVRAVLPIYARTLHHYEIELS